MQGFDRLLVLYSSYIICFKVHTIKINLYGSLAATGKGKAIHTTSFTILTWWRTSYTPSNPPWIGRFEINVFVKHVFDPIGRLRSWDRGNCYDRCSVGHLTERRHPMFISSRFNFIKDQKLLNLAGKHRIHYDMDRDMLWRMEPLPTHPNG